jgi:nitrate/nitrite transporter NarK
MPLRLVLLSLSVFTYLFLLKVSYDLSLTDAAARAAGFVLLATIARPVGGWLSDKVGAKRVVQTALCIIIPLATCLLHFNLR